MPLNRRTAVLAVLIALSMVLAGCTGGGGADGGGVGGGAGGGEDVSYAGSGGAEREARTVVAEATATPRGTPAPREARSDGGDREVVGQQVVIERDAIIKTGQVRLEVEEFDGAVQNLTVAIRDQGGYVSDSHEETHRIDNKTWTTGQLVLRVPRDNFSAMMVRVQEEGTVMEASTNSQDVTDQLVDIRARLSNLRAQRDQLRELYQRANTTQDILAVQRRLSDVQTEIERLEARQKSLRERVAYSTITVRIEEPRPEPERPDIERWYDTPVVEAFLESVDGVVVTVRALGVFLAFALPYLVVFGLPLVVIGGVYWRRQRADGAVIPALGSDDEDRDDDEDGADNTASSEAEESGHDGPDATESEESESAHDGSTDDESKVS
ncbi:MAG: DUF4349 domain-containing protein [Halobacteriales archaeon]|nr:DUF4349 domain-containing protein [Halobacteriales archaeon]